MYKLRLNAKDCISCGICMDVCVTKAIDMRIHKGKTIEGSYLAYLEFSRTASKELLPEQMMTFPFIANSELCDGCMICVNECPTFAIDIVNDIEDYHEKLEENFLFPRFKKVNTLVELVDVLLAQHQSGRVLTDKIMNLKSPF